jgi:hypothetical protein
VPSFEAFGTELAGTLDAGKPWVKMPRIGLVSADVQDQYLFKEMRSSLTWSKRKRNKGGEETQLPGEGDAAWGGGIRGREERTSLARLAFSQCPPCLAIRNTFFRASTSTVGLLPGPEEWHLPNWRVNHLTQPLSPDNRLY